MLVQCIILHISMTCTRVCTNELHVSIGYIGSLGHCFFSAHVLYSVFGVGIINIHKYIHAHIHRVGLTAGAAQDVVTLQLSAAHSRTDLALQTTVTMPSASG